MDSMKREDRRSFDSASLRQFLLGWCYKDSLFRMGDEGIRLFSFDIKKIKTLKIAYSLSCIVYFYKEGEVRKGIVMPVEGHGIVENKLLVRRERAYFQWKKNQLVFLKWYR
jgi:hypothetical protein